MTSSVPAEGKTYVASNLAQSIVRQPDRKVLLIDADLRASRLHQVRGSRRGDDLVLTIDRSMQYETERALAQQIVAAKAKGGIAVVMDPHTGEILSMANLVAAADGGAPVPAPSCSSYNARTCPRRPARRVRCATP